MPPNRLIQIKYRGNNFENMFRILSATINPMIATKISTVGATSHKNLSKMLKNRRKCKKSQNSAKIP